MYDVKSADTGKHLVYVNDLVAPKIIEEWGPAVIVEYMKPGPIPFPVERDTVCWMTGLER